MPLTPEERRERNRASNKRYRQTHKAECQAYAKSYRAAHRTPSEHRRAYNFAYLKRYYAANKEAILAKARAQYAANRDAERAESRARAKRAYAADPDSVKARSKKYLSTEHGRAKYAARYLRVAGQRVQRTRAWKIANRHHVNAASAARNAAKLRGTPAWADHAAIESAYAHATRLTTETGIKHDVDHIVPLKSRFVCGLHVAHNLQVLPHIENVRKGNRISVYTGPPQSLSD